MLPALLAAQLPISAATGLNISVLWNPSTNPAVAGYNVFYGGVSQQFTNSVSVGLVTNAVISGLAENTPYFFAATTHDGSGNLSAYSQQVAFAGFSTPIGSSLQLESFPTNYTSDPLNFSLDASAPTGATINPTNGVFYWTPGQAYASTTNFINVVVTDTVSPSLDISETLVIMVNGNGPFQLNYAAGTNGTLSGTSPQTVNYGASGSQVTAVPNAGYHFVSWSDGSTANPRTDTGVTTNLNVAASFAINTYTLAYVAGTNSTVLGATPLTAVSGGGGTPGSAVPGTLSGTTPQTVNYGASGTPVTAVPNAGYHFVNWSDGSTANPRTDTGVTTNLSVTASFAINTYTLTYLAGKNGTISGTTPQTVNYGASGTPVSAVSGIGYSFVHWSDGSTANPRTDLNVTNALTLTASFVNLSPPVITPIGMSASGQFTLSGTGVAGQSYILLMATNMMTPMAWLPVATNTADTNGVINFSDPQATNNPRRFYRLLAP